MPMTRAERTRNQNPVQPDLHRNIIDKPPKRPRTKAPPQAPQAPQPPAAPAQSPQQAPQPAPFAPPVPPAQPAQQPQPQPQHTYTTANNHDDGSRDWTKIAGYFLIALVIVILLWKALTSDTSNSSAGDASQNSLSGHQEHGAGVATTSKEIWPHFDTSEMKIVGKEDLE